MRSGTRSECKRRWTPKGHRPRCRVKLGYQYCYLYAALNPYSGALFALILPDMTKDSFCMFSEAFGQYLSGTDDNSKGEALLIADGAGAHLGEVCRAAGFSLERLPTACPELNPVERFFEELRKELACNIFDDLEGVEQKLCEVLRKYYDTPELITSLTQFPYLTTT